MKKLVALFFTFLVVIGVRAQSVIQKACDSDSFFTLAEAINNDKAKYEEAVKYLREKDNLSLLLKIMSIGVAGDDLVNELKNLSPQQTSKINRVGKDDLSPVHLYALKPELAIYIRMIANDGADLDVVTSAGVPPLVAAAEIGCLETVKMLVNNGASVNKKDETGWTPLHYACQLGDIEIVKFLVESKADVNALTPEKVMPLHLAVSTYFAAQMDSRSPNGTAWSSSNALKCFNYLRSKGANMTFTCAYGFSGNDFLRRIGSR